MPITKGISLLQQIKVFWNGFIEGNGDTGLTFNNDPNSKLSTAYDKGRNLRRLGK